MNNNNRVPPIFRTILATVMTNHLGIKAQPSQIPAEIKSIVELRQKLEERGYITTYELAIAVYDAIKNNKPLMLEGPPGSGKTFLAKKVAQALDLVMFRIQCYEGITKDDLIGNWNYQKQLLYLQSGRESKENIYSLKYFNRGKLLEAVLSKVPNILLIDEFDKCLTENTYIQTTSGICKIKDINIGDKVISFSPENFETTISKVIKKRELKTKSYNKIFVGGKIINATDNHRFIVYDKNGNITEKKSKELEIGDYIPVYNNIISESNFNNDDIYKISENRYKISKIGREKINQRRKELKYLWEDLSKKVGLSVSYLKAIINGNRKSLRKKYLDRLCNILKIERDEIIKDKEINDEIIELKDFWEIVGYMTGDGSISINETTYKWSFDLADKDVNLLTNYKDKINKVFNIKGSIYERKNVNGYSYKVGNKFLIKYLKKIFPNHLVYSKNRSIEKWVFQLENKNICSFLKGFFDAEGSVGNHFIHCASSSEDLIIGIQMLLTKIGITANIYPQKSNGFNKGSYYQLIIPNTDKFKKYINFNSIEKRKKLEKLKYYHTRTHIYPQNIIKPILNDIKENNSISNMEYGQAIYDILSERTRPTFFSINKISESFKNKELQALINQRIALGKVTKILKINEQSKVYDLTINSDPFFIGNQIVTHNSDEELEYFLLEFLDERSITIPEFETIHANSDIYTFLTSNKVRTFSEPTQRRYLYFYIDYPDEETEMRIIQANIERPSESLIRQVVELVHILRDMDLEKVPSPTEAIEFTKKMLSIIDTNNIDINKFKITKKILQNNVHYIGKTENDQKYIINKIEDIVDDLTVELEREKGREEVKEAEVEEELPEEEEEAEVEEELPEEEAEVEEELPEEEVEFEPPY
ncbi:MAG: AAA domain-containing protein [Candidatus Lokiarchaeota archaeon]|nr:AAA domain-containing protein [Candidatus Lokiarchaeota archaeon]